jgi:hypothetical protein
MVSTRLSGLACDVVIARKSRLDDFWYTLGLVL